MRTVAGGAREARGEKLKKNLCGLSALCVKNSAAILGG